MEAEKEKIDLFKLLVILKKRLRMILVFSVLGLILSAVITFKFITPIYQAKTQIIVRSSTSNNSQTTAQEIQGNVQIINTYNEILISPVVLNQVIKQLNLNTTATSLQHEIKLSTETNSQVITMSVNDKNKFVAKDIANTTVDVFKTEVTKIMNVDNVAVLAPAIVSENTSPISPNKKINLTIGILSGFILGFIIALLRYFLDTTIKSSQDIERVVELPVLGEIPLITINEKEK
ncbi:YveK family protein [Lactococcus lactis]|jgi:capsular polysaccharide biosynthesis protein|uniref:YveK family protein n=1 Tax=Lactococcus lactis TaxID=1358 RepID=UPI0016521F79|nr:Wzz/FepE/Etk N-terminal domain-containing protein [Lactococcus lactis]QNL92859.1 capsular biosynthesis protein [Lactococcus lactis]